MTRLRDLLTVTLAISAGVHAALIQEHWDERHVLGVGFALSVVALVACVLVLQLGPPRLGALLSIAVQVGLVALYFLSRTVGFPLVGQEGWDLVGLLTQAVQLVGLGLAVLLVHPFPRHLKGASNVSRYVTS